MLHSAIISVVIFAMSSAIFKPVAFTDDVQPHAVLHDQWLLSFKDRSTNQVRWDPRFKDLLQRGLPHYGVKWWSNRPLPEAALALLSGPPNPVQVESNRFVTLSACAEGVCKMKGLLWVDTDSPPNMIVAFLDESPIHRSEASMTLYTRSDDLAAKLPPQFLSSLVSWQSHSGITKITSLTMVNGEDHATQLPLDVLGNR